MTVNTTKQPTKRGKTFPLAKAKPPSAGVGIAHALMDHTGASVMPSLDAAATLESALEKALETRLQALTQALQEVEVLGKGVDMVKEIKELHNLLESVRQRKEAGSTQQAPRLVVVWQQSASLPLETQSTGFASSLSVAEESHYG